MENERSEAHEDRVVVGPPPPASGAPEDVLPAVVRTQSDGTQRYICYTDATPGDSVVDTRLSVDASVVLNRELWR